MATPTHDVSVWEFDKGSYAEFDFALYQSDGVTRFGIEASDLPYVKIGTNGVAAVLSVSETATAGGSVIVPLTTTSNGLITLKIGSTDSLALTATTLDFQVYIIDTSDSSKTKYTCRGKFKVLPTVL